MMAVSDPSATPDRAQSASRRGIHGIHPVPGCGCAWPRHWIIALLAATLLLFAGASLASGPDPDRFIVKFQEGKAAQGRAALRGASAEVLLELGRKMPSPRAFPHRRCPVFVIIRNIEYIEVDPPRYPMAQTVPYGIGMVQADTTRGGLAPGGFVRRSA
jgi:hypothetical protein